MHEVSVFAPHSHRRYGELDAAEAGSLELVKSWHQCSSVQVSFWFGSVIMWDMLRASVLCAAALLSCDQEQATPSHAEAPQPPPPPTLLARLAVAESLDIARAEAAAEWGETTNQESPAAVQFAVWASGHEQDFNWMTVNDLPAISIAEAMKDPAPVRGKRMCAVGTVAEIQTDRSTGSPLYFGALVTREGKGVRFVVVGDTTGVVDGSDAHLCGVFTGNMAYKNASGGTRRAPVVVGLFSP